MPRRSCFCGTLGNCSHDSQGDLTRVGSTEPWGEDNGVEDFGPEWIGSTNLDLSPAETHLLKLSGWVNGKFQWVPDYVGDISVPPHYVSFRVHSGALATWNIPVANVISGVSNGYSGDLQTIQYNAAGSMWRLDKKDGYRLARVDTSTGYLNEEGHLTVKLPRVNVEASVSMTNNSGVEMTQQLNLNYKAEEDLRFVRLSRNGKDRFELDADGNWITYGDTTYSYTSHSPLSAPAYMPNRQTINAGLSGGWSTDSVNNALGRYNITWNWVQTGDSLEMGTTAGDHYDHADRIAAKGGIDYWTNFLSGNPQWCDADGNFPSKPPAQATLKYFARDNVDEATAEARYVMTVHEPIELVEKRKLVKAFSVKSPAYVQNSSGQWGLLDVISGFMEAGTYTVTINKGAAQSQGFSVGATGDAKPFGFGIGFGYQQDEGKQWYKEYGQSISNPRLEEGQRAYLEVVFDYQRLYSTFRRYDVQGEIRREGSPDAPAPSLPYKAIWDELADVTPSQRWHVLQRGEAAPDPKNDLPVYSGDPITES